MSTASSDEGSALWRFWDTALGVVRPRHDRKGVLTDGSGDRTGIGDGDDDGKGNGDGAPCLAPGLSGGAFRGESLPVCVLVPVGRSVPS